MATSQNYTVSYLEFKDIYLQKRLALIRTEPGRLDVLVQPSRNKNDQSHIKFKHDCQLYSQPAVNHYRIKLMTYIFIFI